MKRALVVVILFTSFSLTAKAPSVAQANLEQLKIGNHRFTDGKVRANGQSTQDIQRLASSQAPKSIMLSCSDSRVTPETVFDQKLGEMFTVRSAGESLSPEAIGSIEYAVEKLKAPLLVVMGHTNCGAVKAALETPKCTSAGSENLDQMVADIRPRIQAPAKGASPSKDLRTEGWENAVGVAKDVLERSKIVKSAVSEGRVKISVALYDLATGAVEFREFK